MATYQTHSMDLHHDHQHFDSDLFPTVPTQDPRPFSSVYIHPAHHHANITPYEYPAHAPANHALATYTGPSLGAASQPYPNERFSTSPKQPIFINRFASPSAPAYWATSGMPAIVKTARNLFRAPRSPTPDPAPPMPPPKENSKPQPFNSLGLVQPVNEQPTAHEEPRPSSYTPENVTKTPSAKAKVLPWVQGSSNLDYDNPIGMWGPYESRPTSVAQSLVSPLSVVTGTAVPPPASRVAGGPYSFTGNATLPFAALAGEASTPANVDTPTRSSMLSRGVANKDPTFVSRGMKGAEVPDRKAGPSGGSAKTRKSRDRQSSRGTGVSPKTVKHKDKDKKPKDKGKAKARPTSSEVRSAPRSSTGAGQSETDRMAARANALAQLTASPKEISQKTTGGQRLSQSPNLGGPAVGEAEHHRHMSFQSTTPSFGHLYHMDGRPIPPPQPITRPVTLISLGGVPPGATAPPRVLRSSHMNLGIFDFPPLSNIAEGTENTDHQPSMRSYVETVTDEEAPSRPPRPRSEGVASPKSPTKSVPRKPVPSEHDFKSKPAKHSKGGEATIQPAKHTKREETSSPTIETRDPPKRIVKRHSYAATTATQVNRLVQNSSFHDEKLCQLLDAARLNHLGDEAKRALMRAARARVIELKDLKERGMSLEGNVVPNTAPLSIRKRERKLSDVSDSSDGRSQQQTGGRTFAISTSAEEEPGWANEILDRLAAVEIAHQNNPDGGYNEDPIMRQTYGLLQQEADAHVIRTLEDMTFSNVFSGQPLFAPGYAPVVPPRHEASIHTLASTVRPGQPEQDPGSISWGSDLEMPQSTVTPPQPLSAAAPTAASSGATPPGPVINIQPPTATHSQAATPMAARSQASRTTGATKQSRNTSQRSRGESAVEQDWDRSHISAIPPGKGAAQRVSSSAPPRSSTQWDLPDSARFESTPTLEELTRTTRSSAPPRRDVIHLTDPLSPPYPNYPDPPPWDLVTQRLYSWALVWDEETFQRALEKIAMDHQVEEFPLTIFAMMTFKRNLKHRMLSVPPLVCDKLFVPPNIAEGINRAVHRKLFKDAAEILRQLWHPFGFHEAPRIIISLTKHGAQEAWLANRYDLSTGRLMTYVISVDAFSPYDGHADGRPFMWWHAIRHAWPQIRVPDPDTLENIIKPVHLPHEYRNDISLRAAVIARNLLAGVRPEHVADLTRLRETIWSEVKRLMGKKRHGKLLVFRGAQYNDAD